MHNTIIGLTLVLGGLGLSYMGMPFMGIIALCFAFMVIFGGMLSTTPA